MLASIAPGLIAADTVFADFESGNYAPWTVEGKAFGTSPATGTLKNQQKVDGFEGKGYVNSYHGGDDSLGRLTSPEFKIEKKVISFLIGGGGFEDRTCMNLVVDGKVVRTATGQNTQSGGTERLERNAWDVAEFIGKSARIEIVDNATGGWGHINIDQIVFSDVMPPVQERYVTREIALNDRYLLLPVKNGATKRRVALIVDGTVTRDFEIELSDNPDWWAHLDVSAWKGKNVKLRAERRGDDADGLQIAKASPTLWKADEIYREPQRGQLHFSARRGWLNDPNGMVYANGEYHLFFQHNPYGWSWGNMHWGHAVSRDLVHWEELPIAFYPPRYHDMAFSGSAVVDHANTSGWQRGQNAPIVVAFTSTGRGECIAYSNDNGRTWTEYEGNPVVRHQGRDPRLLWHEPSKQWVMVTYTEDSADTPPKRVRDFAFYTSPDLKKWTYQSRISGLYECPDLVELPVDNDPSNRKWVLSEANSEYFVGSFDGKVFTPETPKLKGHRGKDFYAAQTFTNEPKGRVVQIGWFRTATHGAPFNQSMSLPLQQTLRSTAEGPRLAWNPVNELETLRTNSKSISTLRLADEERRIEGIDGELLEVRATIRPGDAGTAGLNVRGVPIAYDVFKKELSVDGHRVPQSLKNGALSLRIFVDRTSIEVFADDGLTFIPINVGPPATGTGVVAFAKDGTSEFQTLEVHELRSIWKR